jgi:hypothetical protein
MGCWALAVAAKYTKIPSSTNTLSDLRTPQGREFGSIGGAALRGIVFPGPSEGVHVKYQKSLAQSIFKMPICNGIGTEFQVRVKRTAQSAALGPNWCELSIVVRRCK